MTTTAHDHKGFSEERCERCGWVMGGPPLNCLNDDTPHRFPSQLPVDQADPVGLIDIEHRLGVAPQTARKWRFRGLLPEPRWHVSDVDVWHWPDVEAWARATGRLTVDVGVDSGMAPAGRAGPGMDTSDPNDHGVVGRLT